MPNKPNSMKTKHYILAIFAALVLVGCYNDDKLWDAVNEQEQRIEALESWQKVANNNIEALQTLVSGKHYITEITPVTLEGKTVGYTIAFNDHAPITIYNGEKGEKGEQGDKGEQGEQGVAGSTPVISITQQTDGNWYWTLNGELMKDANGKSIRANGQDGADGEDGKPGQNAPTPVLKTGKALDLAGVSGTWTADAIYLSVDGGTTWTQVSGRNGTNGVDGDAFFAGIDTTHEDYVIFTLAEGGGKINVPRYKALALSFSYTPAGGTETTIDPVRDILAVSTAKDLVIKYGISSDGIEKMNVRVSAFLPSVATGKMTASVDRDAKSITLRTTTDGLGIIPLLITTTDNAGHSCTYELTLRTPYSGGDGTEAEPYQISSADELAYLSEQVNGGQNYEGKYFLLTEDIDLTGRKWKPIGKVSIYESFKGSFNGGGHSISNMNVDDIDNGGLFGTVKKASVIQNIRLLSPTVNARQFGGALIGWCENVELIKNCYAENIICSVDAKDTMMNAAGGLVGMAAKLVKMENCHVKNAKVTGLKDVGGLLGGASSNPGEAIQIHKCSATECTITASGKWGHGGLIGTQYAGALTLKGCYTTGTIYSGTKGDNSQNESNIAAGALIGQGRGSSYGTSAYLVQMLGCYSTMVIQSDAPEDKYSLRGVTEPNTFRYDWKFSSCYYITSYTGQTPTNGITYQPVMDENMIQAMNKELKEDIYKTDGTYK